MGERFKLIAEGLEVAPLVKLLEDKPELWQLITARQNYPGSAHKETETIYLRWAKDTSIEGGFYCLESEDMPVAFDLYPTVSGPIKAALWHIFGTGVHDVDLGRVIITRLKPGGVIAEHVDEGPYADKYERFHLCLQGQSAFVVGGKEDPLAAIMKSGELWWFNHKRPHWVKNGGSTERIHLIIDLVAPEYRKLRGLTFQRERPHELLDEARPLFEAHYHEVAHYQDIPLDINEAAYMQLEEAGLLRCFTARDCGELIGYCVFMVKPNLRYSSSIQAVQDILYLDKSRRGALIGKRLLEYCHGRLKAEGVQVVYQHAKIASTVGQFFEAIGYTLIDGIYGKRLDR